MLLLLGFACSSRLLAAVDEGQVLVVVNGKPITERDARRLAMLEPDSSSKSGPISKAEIDELIDRQLVSLFLDKQKIKANELELDRQVSVIKRLIARRGLSVDELYARYALDEPAFREMIALSVRWHSFIRKTITDEEVRTYFAERQQQFDGTKVRARQIFLNLPTDPSQQQIDQAVAQLNAIRLQVAQGQLDFAAAAASHSQAPSREQGGDVGFIAFRGDLPVEVSEVAFGLKSGEIGQPIVTRYGVHLVQVTDRKEGMLSLEDARIEVLGQMSRETWNRLASQQRSRAKIEWKVSPEAESN